QVPKRRDRADQNARQQQHPPRATQFDFEDLRQHRQRATREEKRPNRRPKPKADRPPHVPPDRRPLRKIVGTWIHSPNISRPPSATISRRNPHPRLLHHLPPLPTPPAARP